MILYVQYARVSLNPRSTHSYNLLIKACINLPWNSKTQIDYQKRPI